MPAGRRGRRSVVLALFSPLLALLARLAQLKKYLLCSSFGVKLVWPRSDAVKDILSKCPHLVGDQAVFVPSPWLFNGHVHTVFCAFGPQNSPHLDYERHLIRVPDGGSLGLDFTAPAIDGDGEGHCLLVALHGLTGGSHEAYVRSVLHEVTTKASWGRWGAVCVNFRGCAGVEVTGHKLYNAGQTDDLRCALLYIRHRFPRARLFAVGFSLGANSLVKYLGEEAEAAPFHAAVSIGNPWDLMGGNSLLESSFMGLIYSRAMASNLRRVLRRHAQVFRSRKGIEWNEIYANKKQTICEFDELFTRRIGGFKSVEEYYTTQSARRFLSSVRVPVLAFHAADDGIANIAFAPTDASNPNVAIAVTRHGGHLGWFEGLRPTRWISKPVSEFLFAAGAGQAAATPMLGTQGDFSRPSIGHEMVVDSARTYVGYQLVRVSKVEGGAPASEAVIKGL